jgi:signal transduction histidine kinase
VVEWLTREGQALDAERVQVEAMFKGLWQTEQEELGRLDAALLCPLKGQGKLIGILGVGWRASRKPYSRDDAELLMTMAAEAALTVENARILDQLRREQQRVEWLLAQTVRAQEEERKRVSMELHDSVAQWLVGASYRIQALRAQLARGSGGETLADLREIQETTEESIKELRAVIAGLHPPDLEEMGFVPALRQTVEVLAKDGATGRLRVEGAPVRLPAETELAVYRIVQEAMNNIRKHARASRVEALLRFGGEGLRLEIADDGQGFDLARSLEGGLSAGHMGLQSMRHRAGSLGGTLEIQTERGMGTRITLAFPLPEPAAEARRLQGATTRPRADVRQDT